MIRKLSALLLLALIVPLTSSWGAGATANVVWTAPTLYSDGSTLPASDLSFYTITYGTQSVKVNAPTLGTVINGVCGSPNFSITVTTTASAKYPNATSAPGGPVPYVSGIACTPNPPTGLAVS